MDNDNKHTAYYQLFRFIGDKKHHHYDLTPYDLTILFMLCRYWDMPSGKCFAKQTVLAKECRMSERQFRDSSKKLHDLKIIERAVRGSLYHYYIGENLNIELSTEKDSREQMVPLKK